MSKGAYDVNNTYVGPSKDGSFRSCLCAMLIFIAICGIILMVSMLLRNNGHKSNQNMEFSESGHGNAFEQKDYTNRYTTRKFSENDVLKSEPPTVATTENVESTTEESEVEFLSPKDTNKPNRTKENLQIETTITEVVSTTDGNTKIQLSDTVPTETTVWSTTTSLSTDSTTNREPEELELTSQKSIKNDTDANGTTSQNNNNNKSETDRENSFTTLSDEIEQTTFITVVLNNEKTTEKLPENGETTTNINEENTTVDKILSTNTILAENEKKIETTTTSESVENEYSTTTDQDETTKTIEFLKDKKEISIDQNSSTEKSYKIDETSPQLKFSEKKAENETTPPTIVETEGTSPPQNEHHELTNMADKCSPECRRVGARILSKMNHSGDACEHFYDYACGGDNSDTNIEDDWPRISQALDHVHPQSSAVYNIFKKFFTSCVDFHTNYDYDRRLEDARFILSSVGQPEDETEVDGKAILTGLLTRLLLHDASPLFDISVDVDRDTQYFVFQMNLGKRFSTLEDKYTSSNLKRNCIEVAKRKYDFSSSFFNFIPLNDMYNVYSECMKNEWYKNETLEKALELFGLYEYESIDHIRSIIEKYKSLPVAALVRKDILTKNFQIKKVSEMDLQYPLIDWKKLLSSLVGKKVHDNDKVQVYFAKFFAELFNNQTFLTSSQYYNAIIAMFAHDLYTNTILPTSMYDSEEYCLEYSSDLMREVASSLYLNAIDTEDISADEKRIEAMFDKMKNKLTEMIEEAEWAADVELRHSFTRKLNSIELDAWNRSLVWKNLSLVQQRMKSVVGINGNYSELNMALIKRNQKMLYNMWDTMAYKEENVWWHILTPYSTLPVSVYELNTIFVPPAMLLINSETMPQYISLVKLGFNLAKAIGSHFDFTGYKYKIGSNRKAILAYEESKICSMFSYSKETEIEFDNRNLKFQVTNDSFLLSMNDRFAEDMAIHLLSDMSNEEVQDYQFSWITGNPQLSKEYSREKLFFIALGQEHCKRQKWSEFFLDLFESEHLPASLLLNNALSHSELFSDVFDCKAGARMNVLYKCKAFPLYDEPEDYDEEYKI